MGLSKLYQWWQDLMSEIKSLVPGVNKLADYTAKVNGEG